MRSYICGKMCKLVKFAELCKMPERHVCAGAMLINSGLAFFARGCAKPLWFGILCRGCGLGADLALQCKSRAKPLRFGFCVHVPCESAPFWHLCARAANLLSFGIPAQEGAVLVGSALAPLRRGRESILAQGHPSFSPHSSPLPTLDRSSAQRGNLLTFMYRNSAQRKSKTC